MKHLLDNLKKLPDWLTRQELPKYRAGQIQRWIASGRAMSFEDMSDLPQTMRELLGTKFQLFATEVIKHQNSADGTEKLLVRLGDQTNANEVVECVLLREANRRTICVSSQVGCAMGCVFCASGLDGVMRSLTAGEIIEQMLRLQRLLPEEERLSHIVMMGMGEPLANLDNVITALEFATSPEGLGISARRITISTVGLPAAIHRLARLDSRYHLAISLHAPNDQLRNQLVPVNEKVGIQPLLAAADHYFEVSGRKLTFEYVLLAGINDGPDHARELAQILKNRTALLNVIPYNPVDGLPYQTPSPASVKTFRTILEQEGVVVKFRQRKGDKINAACGQLRRVQNQLTGLG